MLRSKTGNAVVSPVSVYTLLAILQQGAGSTTREEVNNVVHAQPDITKTAYKILINRYNVSIIYIYIVHGLYCAPNIVRMIKSRRLR